MAEIYEDWLISPMTRAEYNELNDEEKAERKRLKKNVSSRKKYKENPEKIKERCRKYSQENPEKEKERKRKYSQENPEKVKERKRKYRETPTGKKVNTISHWKQYGLQESKEDLDRIYELYLHQELCNACDVKLTRNRDNSSTDATMDHDHDTHRFRHIICRGCNTHDNWKKYFC
jgi:hypothetical protein